MEFCTTRELTNQVGHDPTRWPEVVVKELVDNALDAAEEADIAPVIWIDISGDTITITDNGAGVPDETVVGVLDYTTRTSNKEVYSAPTRSAQGNALKTILAMAFTLHGERGETIIQSRGIEHRIVFRVDQILLQPKIHHERASIPFAPGTKITVTLPPAHGYQSFVRNARGPLLRMAEAYCWLNPHVALQMTWDGVEVLNVAATKADWPKWKPLHPTSRALVRSAPLRALHGRACRQQKGRPGPDGSRLHRRVRRLVRHGEADGASYVRWEPPTHHYRPSSAMVMAFITRGLPSCLRS